MGAHNKILYIVKYTVHHIHIRVYRLQMTAVVEYLKLHLN